MRTLYEAEDGKIFLNEDECYAYETLYKFPELLNIQFYDKENQIYHIKDTDPFNSKYYIKCEKIYIHNFAELMCLHWITKECGWCEFDQISEPGLWIRKEQGGSLFGKWILSDK